IEKLKRVGAQFFLTGGDSFVTVFAFLLAVLVAFTNQPVRRGDQIFLPARECVLILFLATATTAATLLLRLLVLHLKWFHFDEVDVAGGLVTRVAGLGVVRDEVAGFEIVFLEEERVGATQRTRRLARQLLQVDLLLFAAVDGE